MPWIVVGADNAQVSGPHAAMPVELDAGLRAVEVALGCVWSPERGAWIDAAKWMAKFDYLLLWTATEMVRVKESSDPAMVRAFMLLNAWEGPINLLSPEVQAGIARADLLGLLDDESRAARIAAGLPPEA